MPNASKITHLIAYGYYLACTMVARLLPLKVVFLIGREIGRVCYYLVGSRRRLATDNLKIALGKSDEEARKLALEHFLNLGANMLSAAKFATMSEEEIFRCVKIDIPEDLLRVLREATGNEPGWVAMISHMGNWELFSHITSIAPKYKYGAIYHKLANDFVDRHFRESRARSGVTLFDRREGYLKCVAFIRNGGAVGVLVDQYAGIPGTWMPFFRRLTSTSTLAARLAQRACADVVPVSITTLGIARWQMTVSRPIPRVEDTELLTAKINEELEKQITASPADWLWSHNRWKTPNWGTLFARTGARIYYPPGFDQSTLLPYRIIVRSVDDPAEAEVSLPAMKAIKEGRPDAHVTVVATGKAAEFWKSIPEIDEVLEVAPGESVRSVANRISALPRFDIGVLFSPERRAALEFYKARIWYRYGPPYRPRLNFWENAPGGSNPQKSGPDRYRRIAQGMGALMFPLE